MFAWLRSAEPAVSNTMATTSQDSYVDDMPPSTPLAMLPIKAFRTALFGTPAPPNQLPREESKTSATTTNCRRPKSSLSTRVAKREEHAPKQPKAIDNLNFEDPFHITSKPNLFNKEAINPTSFQSFGVDQNLAEKPEERPISPTKGILRTPATLARRRKAVTFHADVPSTPPEKHDRVRSGLPNQYPGKFPSPFTPRIDTPEYRKAAAEGLLPSLGHKSGNTGMGLGQSVSEDTRIEDILGEADFDDEADLYLLKEQDLTSDLNAPKSESGKFWRSQTKHLEKVAFDRFERQKGRLKMAVSYAQRKDAICVNLSEKLRETMEKNQILKDEIKRLRYLGKSGSAPTIPSLGSDENERFASMKTTVEDYAKRLAALQYVLDQREEEITNMSMSMLSNGVSNKVIDRQGFLHLKEGNEDLKNKNADLEFEKIELQRKLELATTTLSTNTPEASDSRVQLRNRISELEQDKRDLRSEMRSKVAGAQKRRREYEKALRAETTAVKTKLAEAELDKVEVEKECARLIIQKTKLESDLLGIRTTSNEHKRRTLDTPRHEQLSLLEHNERIKSKAKENAPLSLASGNILPQSGPQKAKTFNSSELLIDLPSDVDTSIFDAAVSSSPPQRNPVGPNASYISSTSANGSFVGRQNEAEKYKDVSLSAFDCAKPVPSFDIDDSEILPGSFSISAVPTPDESNFRRKSTLRASPRPSMVAFSPARNARQRRKSILTGGSRHVDTPRAGIQAPLLGKNARQRTKTGVSEDPARRAAAEQRLAERRNAKAK